MEKKVFCNQCIRKVRKRREKCIALWGECTEEKWEMCIALWGTCTEKTEVLTSLNLDSFTLKS